MLIGIGNSKGGAGKSSTALMLTGAIIDRSRDTPITLIDTDIQASVANFYQKRVDAGFDNYNVECFFCPPGTDLQDVLNIAREADDNGHFVIIDAAGYPDPYFASILSLTDILIIPAALNTEEIQVGMNYLQWLETSLVNRESRLLNALFLNRVDPIKSVSDKEIRMLLETLNVDQFLTEIPNLPRVKDIRGLGQYPFELIGNGNSVKSSQKLAELSLKFLDELLFFYENGKTMKNNGRELV